MISSLNQELDHRIKVWFQENQNQMQTQHQKVERALLHHLVEDHRFRLQTRSEAAIPIQILTHLLTVQKNKMASLLILKVGMSQANLFLLIILLQI